MKSKLSIILFCFLSFSSFGQIITSKIGDDITKTDLQEMNLVGGVKSVQETSYVAITKGDSIVKGKRKRESPEWKKDYWVKINSFGYIYNTVVYNSDGSMSYKFVSDYTDSGKVKEHFNYNSDGVLLGITNCKYKYDSKGNIIEQDWFRQDSTLDNKTIFQYDEKGNLIVSNWIGTHSTHKDSMTYDEMKNISGMWDFQNGKLSWHYSYLYDEKHNLTEEIWYSSNEKFYMKYNFKYDDKGNRTEVMWENARGTKCTWTFQYSFDSKGNWIKSVQYLDGKANYILEREIEYF